MKHSWSWTCDMQLVLTIHSCEAPKIITGLLNQMTWQPVCFFSFLQSVNKPFCSLFIPLSRDFVNIQDAPYFSSSCILWSEVIECKLSSLYSCNTGRVFWNRWHSLGKNRVARIIAHLRGSQGQIQATSETNGFCGYVDLLKRRIRGSIKNSEPCDDLVLSAGVIYLFIYF